MTSKTKHLDTAIDLLRGSAGVKRAKRRADVEFEVFSSDGPLVGATYTITANSRVLESGAGDAAYAKQRAEERAARLRALGKTVVIYTY